MGPGKVPKLELRLGLIRFTKCGFMVGLAYDSLVWDLQSLGLLPFDQHLRLAWLTTYGAKEVQYTYIKHSKEVSLGYRRDT